MTWKILYGHDTHKVKRDRKGRILGDVVVPFEDYQRAVECVNACAGLDVANLAKLREVAEAVVEWAKTPGNHGGNPYCHDFVKLALAATGDPL